MKSIVHLTFYPTIDYCPRRWRRYACLTSSQSWVTVSALSGWYASLLTNTRGVHALGVLGARQIDATYLSHTDVSYDKLLTHSRKVRLIRLTRCPLPRFFER